MAGTSGYRGVCFNRRAQTWVAGITCEGRHYSLGMYSSAEAAAEAYDCAALFLRGSDAKLNFPRRGLKPIRPEQLQRRARFDTKRDKSSRYLGVYRAGQRARKAWCARLKVAGKKLDAGSWNTEREAAIARDRAALYHQGEGAELNFPVAARARGPASAEELRRQSRRAFKAEASSRYRGVSFVQRLGKWTASLQHRNRTYALGSYDSEAEAARIYDAAAFRLLGSRAALNFPDQRLRALPVRLERVLRRRKPTERSLPRGVEYDRANRRFGAALQIGDDRHHLGRWPTAREAALAYDRARLHFGKAAIHFPGEAHRLGACSPEVLRHEAGERHDELREIPNRGLRGVTREVRAGPLPWSAHVGTTYLGAWRTAEDAALAHDRAVLHYGGTTRKVLNFPKKARRLGPADALELRALSHAQFKKLTTSRFRGVCWSPRHGKWCSNVGHLGTSYSAGKFDDEEAAARAYDRLARRLHRTAARLNFDPVTGEERCGQPTRRSQSNFDRGNGRGRGGRRSSRTS